MPSGIYRHHSTQGKPIKKREHLSVKTEFKKGEENPNFGKRSPRWNGGKYRFQGYWFIYNPKHPRASSRGYVKQSLLVAEKKLGRQLKFEEVVHHINGLRDDDRPENLWVFPNRKSHGLYEGNLHITYKKWIQQDYNL